MTQREARLRAYRVALEAVSAALAAKRELARTDGDAAQVADELVDIAGHMAQFVAILEGSSYKVESSHG